MDTLAVQLMVPTTKPIADFHRLVTAHAGQTKKTAAMQGLRFQHALFSYAKREILLFCCVIFCFIA